MGETRNGQIAAQNPAVEPMAVDTLGGRMHVSWDESAQATPNGQLVFFAEFLRAAGVFDEWVRACPLEYRSGNAPGKRDVLGTLLLAILAGHRRYAHVTSLRGDGVAAQALGMDRIVSEDALRRALSRIDEMASAAWLCPALIGSVRDALEQPWILDIDASIKPLYGRQEGAELGYNPHKPGRPSHVLHTTGWAICGWCWTCRSVRASSTRRRMRRPGWHGCSTNWAAGVRRWYVATAAMATKAFWWNSSSTSNRTC
jgi:hypothetical protein